jgi:hypothetical protein
MAFPWSPGQVLTASALNDEFGSKLPYAFGTATPTTTENGFLWYDSNSTPAAPKFWTGSAFQALTSGKILQVVRATDSTARTTTSGSYVDASISVTITPQKSDSAVILLWSARLLVSGGSASNAGGMQITDASNNAISGAEDHLAGVNTASDVRPSITVIAYATPAVATAVTYKGRFRTASAASTYALQNADNTGQLFAIEVSA